MAQMPRSAIFVRCIACRQPVAEVDVLACGHFQEQLAAVLPGGSAERLVRVATLSARLMQPSLGMALREHELREAARHVKPHSKSQRRGDDQEPPATAPQAPGRAEADAAVHAHVVGAGAQEPGAGVCLTSGGLCSWSQVERCLVCWMEVLQPVL